MIQKSITIDLWKEYRQPIDLVQYEAEGRTLNITLTNGGQVVDLTGASVTFNMTKGTDVIYNACTNVDEAAGKISLLITGAICDTSGTFDAFIEIVKTDDVLRTQNFDVTVKPSVDNSGAIESTSEFTALQAELAQISANEADIATNASDIANITADYVPRATFVNENIVIADGTNGDIKDSTKSLSDLMDSVGSDVVDGNIAVFNGTSGKVVKDSGLSLNGWIDANETWVYASATTITVPSGAASKYKKGDKFKLTANSVELQGYIVSVADTLLTVAGDALTNHVFSDNYYSRFANPVGFKHWFDWTPSFSASGSMTYTSVTVGYARFKIDGNTAYYRINASGTTGGSASTAIIFSVPVIEGFGDTYGIAGASTIKDGSTAVSFTEWWNTSNIGVYKRDSSVWGIGTSRQIKAQGFYEI